MTAPRRCHRWGWIRAALAACAVSALPVAAPLAAPPSAPVRGAAIRPAIMLARPALPLTHQGSAFGLPRVARQVSLGTVRIVAFGSSSTQGIGASSRQASYPSQLQADLATLLPHVTVVVINQGIGGQDAADFALRVPSVLAARPDLVILQTGTNDPLRGLPLPRFVALTRDVVSALKASDVDVMLMEPQLCRVTQATPASVLYRDAVRDIAADMRVPLIRRWDLMQTWLKQDVVTPVQMLAPDGLHMADAGYSLLAHEVAREIVAQTQVMAQAQ